MITNNETKQERLIRITDAQRALEILTTELISDGKNTHHIWQELINVDKTLNYIASLIDRHHTELEKEGA